MLNRRGRVGAGLFAVGAAGALLVPMAIPTHATQVDLKAHLVGSAAAPGAQGKAEYEAEHGTRTFETELQLAGLHNSVLRVSVHGSTVGSMRVDSHGHAQLELSSGAPGVAAGNVVQVRTPSGGLVAQGTLRTETD